MNEVSTNPEHNEVFVYKDDEGLDRIIEATSEAAAIEVVKQIRKEQSWKRGKATLYVQGLIKVKRWR